jgi:site-specific DNA recombinase
LEQNKRHSPRRTIEPTLLQGMLVCERCGYGLYRTSTQTSARRLYCYRCIGSDAYRHLKGAVCDNPPVRQDQLDAVVWKEVVRLLEDPATSGSAGAHSGLPRACARKPVACRAESNRNSLLDPRHTPLDTRP